MDDVQVNVPSEHENISSSNPQPSTVSKSAWAERWLRLVEIIRSIGDHKVTFILSIIVSVIISLGSAAIMIIMLGGLGVMGANHTQFLRQTYADAYWVLQILNFVGPVATVCSCILAVIVIRAERFSVKFGKTTTTIVRKCLRLSNQLTFLFSDHGIVIHFPL